jgi:hypothetical protein
MKTRKKKIQIKVEAKLANTNVSITNKINYARIPFKTRLRKLAVVHYQILDNRCRTTSTYKILDYPRFLANNSQL